MALTDTKIKRLKPTDKCTANRPDKYSDGNGLQLWVRHTGTKVWISAYRYMNKQQTITLGKYPILGLADARNKNYQLKEILANGGNPKNLLNTKATQQDTAKLFDVIAQQFYDEKQKHITAGTFRRDYNAYTKDIKPFIGNKLIDDITAPEILDIAHRINNIRNLKTMGSRAIGQISQIFDYAIRLGITTHNTARDLNKAIPRPKKEHFARINYSELGQLLTDVDNSNAGIVVKHGIYIICYTFVRTKELRYMRWQDIDFDRNLWLIPAEIMKARRPHIVPLVPQVVKLLQEIKNLGLSNEYVFYNNSTHKPYSENFITSLLKRIGYKDKMTGHGFRGLASTTLNELGEHTEATIELQLAHDHGTQVSRAYNSAKLIKQRTQLMHDWADMVDDAKRKYTSSK